MPEPKPKTRKQLSDAALIERVQSLLINAAEGRRSIADDRQYSELRKEFRRRPFVEPQLIATHPTVDSFMAAMGSIADRSKRVERVRDQFKALLETAETTTTDVVHSSDWTGPVGRAARLRVVRELLPLAQSAVGSLISELSKPGPNGGPLLDERKEALEHLRELYRTLGEYLSAVDAGHFDDDLGEGLAAEVARYAKRTARALRNDPIPYLSSALLLGIFSACGMPGIGAYLSGVTLNVSKHSGKQPDA